MGTETMLVVKILLVLSGACLTVASIGFETFRPKPEDGSGKWWQRLTRAGWIAVTAAAAIVVFGTANEILAAREAVNLTQSNERLKRQIWDIEDEGRARTETLKHSKKLLEQAIGHLTRQRDRSRLLERALEQTSVERAFAKVSLVDAPDTIPDIRDLQDKLIFPKPGDTLRWKISCQTGRRIDEDLWPEGCDEYSYGRLVGYQQHIVIDSLDSASGIKKNRGPATPLSLLLPRGICAPVRNALSEHRCHIEIRHEAKGREALLEVLEARGFSSYNADAPLEGDLCREYELLYADTCAALLKRE